MDAMVSSNDRPLIGGHASARLDGRIGLLSNANLSPWINWTTLAPPLFKEIGRLTDSVEIAPPPLSIGRIGGMAGAIGRAWSVKHMFQFQASSKPELPLLAISAMRGFVKRSAFVVDPWRPQLGKIAIGARLQRLDHVFIPYIEAWSELSRDGADERYHWLPFGVDTTVFDSHAPERDIDIYWMGRRYEPLHRALLDLSEQTGLKYAYTGKVSMFDNPMELGNFVSRCRYFVVTPPDLDNPERTGGFSPLVMRYLEGLAAGCRLLGVLPKSGSFERLLPRNAILEVASDGSDLAEKLAADMADPAGWDATMLATRLVRDRHSWAARARTIVDVLARG